MNTPVQSVGLFRRLLAMASPVTADCFPWPSVDACGPATPASPKLRPDGAAQLKTRRMILAAKARQARDNRQSKLASTCEAELRAVTLECLRRGL